MFPIGTRVTVKSVDHLGGVKRPHRLIGRRGVVMDHENGLNVVSLLTPADWLTGLRVFADTDLIAGATGPIPWLPPAYRLRGYRSPNTAHQEQ